MSTTMPDCEVDQAPHLPGRIRLTVIFEDGGGDTAYFDPAILPEIMQRFDRTQNGYGQTFRTQVQTLKGWAKLREIAYRKLASDRENAMLVLLWLYFRCPDVKLRVADKIQAMLDSEGMACLAIVRNRHTGTTAATVMARFDARIVEMSALTMPANSMVGVGLDDGPAGTA